MVLSTVLIPENSATGPKTMKSIHKTVDTFLKPKMAVALYFQVFAGLLRFLVF